MSTTAPGATGPSASSTQGGGPANGSGSSGQMSNQNLNQIVTDFLIKRGFNRTERVFREESRNINDEGRPIEDKTDAFGPKKYQKAFDLLRSWVENNLGVYKFELGKLLWPYFVYSWMELVQTGEKQLAKAFLEHVWEFFEKYHADDLRTFSTISTSDQLKENRITALYRNTKYRIPLNQHITGDLFHFLERESEAGGNCVRFILQNFCQVDTAERGPISPYSFEAILRRAEGRDLEDVDMQEGIPGINIGISNKDVLNANGPLKLGPLPMEEMLREDVRAELLEEDQRRPPRPGQNSLVDEFDQKIKREESADDGPSRADLPLPPSRVRDVLMEMQKVRENRDRFKIEGRTGGIGPGVSCCMFTLHNTLGSVSSMDFSKDNQLVAVGTMDSYIRVWTLDGSPLKSTLPGEGDLKINNRKLIGHSAPVYGVSFSDAVENGTKDAFGEKDKDVPWTGSKFLLSASGDSTVRLWSLETWSCLCIYKSHHGPVMKVQFGPHGHYFLTGGWDKTARIFMQDHISAVRILVGHDTSISSIAWHPNGTYVFSASDETDKSIRMWSIVTGQCVRVFVGHTDYISSMECAPNGKILASADNSGNIFFWDVDKGTRIKRSRGHGKGGIWSMSFSAESTVLASAGQDCTVRIWDVELPAEGHKAAQQQVGAQPGQEPGETAAAATVAAGAGSGSGSAAASGQASGAGGAPGHGKKKGKEVMITPDQISCFSTKKTPVRKVQFTRMNLVVAGGCFEPDR